MSWFKEQSAKETANKQQANKTAKDNDALREGYFTAKNERGKNYYDFIQKNKTGLKELFNDVPEELKLIDLVPSLDEEIDIKSSKEKTKERNKVYQDEPELREAKIRAKDQSIKSIRNTYRPDIAKLKSDEMLYDAAIRKELKRNGYLNPSQAEVDAVKKDLMEDAQRVERANEYESKPGWQKFGYGMLFPRMAESRAEGYVPQNKDLALDITEGVATTLLPFGALKTISKMPKTLEWARNVGKGLQKIDQATKGIPGFNMVGDAVGKVGRVGAPVMLSQLGVDVADNIAYDDRERGDRDVFDVATHSIATGILPGMIGGFMGRGVTKEQQKLLDEVDKAVKNKYVFKRPETNVKAKNVELDQDLRDFQKYQQLKKMNEAQPSGIIYSPEAYEAVIRKNYENDPEKLEKELNKYRNKLLEQQKSEKAVTEYKEGIVNERLPQYVEKYGGIKEFNKVLEDYMEKTGRDKFEALEDLLYDSNHVLYESTNKATLPFYRHLSKELEQDRQAIIDRVFGRNIDRSSLVAPIINTSVQRTKGAHKIMNDDRGQDE